MASSAHHEPITIFLCGDVMTGRGIDQILPHPSDPEIHESFMCSALGYVALSEHQHGPIRRAVSFDYVWGGALAELSRAAPDARVINLETSITTSDAWEPKGINYRMHPDNVECLSSAGIQCCALANNHVLDWGRGGLRDTLRTLHRARIHTAGAGANLREARALAALEVPDKGRVLVIAFGTESSGIPRDWSASPNEPGVYLLREISAESVAEIAAEVRRVKRPRDVVIASIHWGGNWGYAVPETHRRFAHALIDGAGVDLVHGHSSHHPQGAEVYRDHLILYGAGDFLNDYEGIGSHHAFRGELSLMYFVTVDAVSGRTLCVQMVPMRIRRLQLDRASSEEARWLCETLDRESAMFGSRARIEPDGRIRLEWCSEAA